MPIFQHHTPLGSSNSSRKVLSMIIFFFKAKRITLLLTFLLLCITVSLYYLSIHDRNRSTTGNSRPRVWSTEKEINISHDLIPKTSECSDKLKYDFFTLNRHLTTLTPHVNASCSLLRSGNIIEKIRVRNIQRTWTNAKSDNDFLREISNCQTIVPTFTENFYVSSKEKAFPLGFVILMSYSNNSVQQYIRLLRLIYRPHNVYCIHIDQKSPDHWIKSIEEFTSCFDNIFTASNPVVVQYASGAILTAHLNCLKDLSSSKVQWKYAIDLHGTELPMATNREMVEALIPLKGINAIKSGINVRTVDHRSDTYGKVTHKATLVPGRGMKLTNTLLDPVPHNMTLYKGADSPNSAFSREFIHFVLTDTRAVALLDYLQDVLSGVEFFFNSLNNLPDAPGGVVEYHRKPSHERPSLPNVVVRHWRELSIPRQQPRSSSPCNEGHYRHRICIVSASDLEWLTSASDRIRYFFFNKYLMAYDHVVMDCMEQQLLIRNLNEHDGDCLWPQQSSRQLS